MRCSVQIRGASVYIDMLGFPKEQHVLNLLNEAVARASTSGGHLQSDILSALDQARTALSAPVTIKSHLPLVLSAARRHVLTVEKHAVSRIIGPDSVSQHEMASLVRLRLICTELLNILAHTLAELKPPRHRDSSQRPGLGGWQG